MRRRDGLGQMATQRRQAQPARDGPTGPWTKTNATVVWPANIAAARSTAAAMNPERSFDLGADLCSPNMEKDAEKEYPPLSHGPGPDRAVEREIDANECRP